MRSAAIQDLWAGKPTKPPHPDRARPSTDRHDPQDKGSDNVPREALRKTNTWTKGQVWNNIALFKMALRSSKQLPLQLRTWGGKRRGAGRPRNGKGCQPHRARENITKHQAAHVTLRIAKGIQNLRTKRTFQAIREAFRAGREREGFRLVHFSVQSNHLHLLAEGNDARALSGGIRGLQIRIARALNRLIGRTGRVFGDRYHSHVLKTPREVRNALAYVLLNARKHGAVGGIRVADGVDTFSSAPWFDGWRGLAAKPLDDDTPVAEASGWLVRVGWRRGGLIDLAGPLRG